MMGMIRQRLEAQISNRMKRNINWTGAMREVLRWMDGKRVHPELHSSDCECFRPCSEDDAEPKPGTVCSCGIEPRGSGVTSSPLRPLGGTGGRTGGGPAPRLTEEKP